MNAEWIEQLKGKGLPFAPASAQGGYTYRGGDNTPGFGILVGKTLKEVEGKVGGDCFIFKCGDREDEGSGKMYQLYHEQDCCEHVYIEDICGDIQALVGSPILQAEVCANNDDPTGAHESVTWTFYRITTARGQVVLRWCGSSNGYYSESVDFCEVKS